MDYDIQIKNQDGTMNYSKVFASLDTISGEIDKILKYYTNNG